jgi:putative flippase GtrA
MLIEWGSKFMQKKTPSFEEYRSLLRWAIVGLITTVIDYILFISIYPVVISVLVANFFAGLVSLSFNYSAHYFWSFKSQTDHTMAALKYFINLVTFWVLSTLLLKILISSGFDSKIAKLMPIPIIAPLSFISLRFFVFKKANNFK